MANDGTAGVLAPLGDGLSAEKRALAESLRELFTVLETSVRRYAGRHHLDAATVSRYLNGTRTPPWQFVARLVADRNAEGRPVTPAVEDMLRDLHRRASSPRSPAGELQRLQEQLLRADEDVRSAKSRQKLLTDALRDRQRRLADLRRRLRRLEREREDGRLTYESAVVAWQGKYEELRDQRDRLREQVGQLKEALEAARLAARASEERCRELERELDVVEARLGSVITRDSLVDALESADRTASVPELLELVERLDTPARITMATELVKAAAQVRPVADAAALIQALYAARQHRHAEAALPAMVAFRPVHDTALLIAEFARAGLDPAAAAVIQTVLDIHSPADIAVIASALHSSGLEEHVTAVLAPAFTIKPLPCVMEMWEELEVLGLLGPAERALDVCARRRSVWDLAELIHLFAFRGTGHLANLIETTAAAHRDAKDVVDLVDALRRRDLPAAAEGVLWRSAKSRSTGHVAALIAALHLENLQYFATTLLSWAVRGWPVEEAAVLIADLHMTSDWQLAVTALSDAARILPAEGFHTLIRSLDAVAEGGAAAVLFSAGAVCPYNDLAHVIEALDACHLFDYAASVFWQSVVSRPAGHAAGLVGALRTAGSRHVSHEALRDYARTRSVRDIAALSLALDSAGLRDEVIACLAAPGSSPFLLLLSTLDELLGGPDLAERILRDTAGRSSVEENVETALTLETLPAKAYRYRRAFEDAASGGERGRRNAFAKKLKERKKKLYKQRLETAGENVREDRRNRHRKAANRIIGFPRQRRPQGGG